MLSINKISVLVAALFAAAKVNAQDFSAFTGTTCDGSVGLDVACDGTCFDFTGRQSFQASRIEEITRINTDTSSLDYLAD